MAPAPALDVEDEGGGGGGGKNEGVVVKSEAACAGNCEDGGGAIVAAETAAGGGDAMAGVVSSNDQVEASAAELVKDEQGDCTECSSSFGDSCSPSDAETDRGGMEVDSPILAQAGGDGASSDGLLRLSRKKKVTVEWRNAVRPLLWRCQWLELRMKNLFSQVSKYDRELALIKHEKELQLAVDKTDGSMLESLQICKSHENGSMKRRKRKRDEDTVDTSLYIKKHQILSYYYDKQNKGAETDGLLIDDDCNGPVGDDTKGKLDTAGLLKSEENDTVLEQLNLKEILLRIDGIHSRALQLQHHLSKARSKQEKMASFVDQAQVKVFQKRQKTKKRSFFSKKDRNTKHQKKKDVNILLQQKDDYGPVLAVTPTLSERATDCLMQDAKENSEENSGERSQSHRKAITVDLLLGADNSLPNDHTGDFCKENTDDVLIDNQAAKEGYQQFEKVKHPPEKPPELTESEKVKHPPEKRPELSEEVAKTAPKVEDASAPVANQEPVLKKPRVMMPVYSGTKRGRKPKKKGRGAAAAFMNQSKRAPKTPDSKEQKAEHAPSAVKKPQTENTSSAVKKQQTENTSSAVRKQQTENTPSAGKKQKTQNTPAAAAKKQKTEDTPSATKKQNAEKTHAAAKQQKSENASSAAKKQKNEDMPSATKKQKTESASSGGNKQKTENTPSKLKIEKAVLVPVNSRRSQRVRKPKIY